MRACYVSSSSCSPSTTYRASAAKQPIALLDGEIGTETEDSTIEHSVERAMRMFDVRVTTFNAFDRIMRGGSEALRALVPRTHAGSSDLAPFDLLWATEGLVERRIELLTRVLRDTRRRAMEAVLKSRVVYDTPFEFLFVRHNRDAKGNVTSETALFSLPATMDSAVDVSLCSTQQGILRTSPGFIHFDTGGSHLQFHGSTAKAKQFIAPLVRPAYGDVFVVPSSVNHFLHNCNLRVSFTNAHFGVCTVDSGDMYVLKVGEAAREALGALVALAPEGCVVRCIMK